MIQVARDADFTTTAAAAVVVKASPAGLMAAAGMKPDRWQWELTTPLPHRCMAICARQSGKSTALSATAVWYADRYPSVTVAVAAPVLRQSSNLLRRCRQFVPYVGSRLVGDAATSLELDNGSRIIALPGDSPNTVRSETVHCLIADEAAWISDELFNVITPMIIQTGGPILIASTPGGPAGFMYNLWTDAEDTDWVRIKAKASEIPRYDQAELAKAKRRMGKSYFTEFECEWSDVEGQVWSPEEIAAILGRKYTPEPGETEPGAAVPVRGVLNLDRVHAAREQARRTPA